MAEREFDLFISYAHEDRDGFVSLLAQKLQTQGVQLWYDEYSIDWGDSLTESIARGIAHSRFGLVVLSRFFISKRWTRHELRGLWQREIHDGSTILPILHEITPDEVRDFDPVLSDIVALDTSRHDLDQIVAGVVRRLRGGAAATEDRSPPDLLDIHSLADCRRLGAQDVVVRLGRYARAVQLSPRSGEVACGYGLVLLHLKRFAEASAQFERARQLTPEAAAPHYYHALALLRGRRPMTLTLGETRQILASLDMALLLDAGNAVFHAYALVIKRDYFQMNGLRVPPPGLESHLQALCDGCWNEDEVAALLDLVVIRDDRLLNALFR